MHQKSALKNFAPKHPCLAKHLVAIDLNNTTLIRLQIGHIPLKDLVLKHTIPILDLQIVLRAVEVT